jgi:hypothetical protein
MLLIEFHSQDTVMIFMELHFISQNYSKLDHKDRNLLHNILVILLPNYPPSSLIYSDFPETVEYIPLQFHLVTHTLQTAFIKYYQ